MAQPNFTWHEVKSSNIKEIAYDANQQILGVRFTSGGEYWYYSVPAITFMSLMNAESKGKYFRAEIQKKYTAEKRTQKETA